MYKIKNVLGVVLVTRKQTVPEKHTRYIARGYVDDNLVIFIVTCPRCDSTWIKRCGYNTYGEQMCKCNLCKKGFVFYKSYKDNRDTFLLTWLYLRYGTTPVIAERLKVHKTTVVALLHKIFPYFHR